MRAAIYCPGLDPAPGHEIVEVYRDAGLSGAFGRDRRPAFDQLLKDATGHRFDVVMAWSVDRLGRSLQHLVSFLTEIHALKIDLYLHQQGLGTSTPAGKAMFQMMGVFAEFERAMSQSRVRAGIEHAQLKGTRSGKAIGPPKTPSAVREAIVEPARQGREPAQDRSRDRRLDRDGAAHRGWR